AKHTNGSLKPKITLRDLEVLSIINTVYADGRWKDPFEEQSTGDGTFHGEAGDAQVPMMHRTFSQMTYSHDEYNTWQRVEIPFDNS
ncbi:serpin family protein, partial [Blautia sp. MSK22_86]|nr:serpin family protein [Blautia sp. MSK22_86]